MEGKQANTLFRPQALSHATNNLLGKVLVTPKASTIMISSVLFTWLCLATYWLFTAEYNRHVTVKGWLEPDRGATHHFSTLSHGVVSELLVTPGELVEIGQPLVKLEALRRNERGDDIDELLRTEISRQLHLLQQEDKRLKQDQVRERQYLQEQTSHLNKELAKLEEIKRVTQEQWLLASQYLDKITHLYEKGWVSEIEFHNARRSALQLRTDLTNLDREALHLQNQLTSNKQQLSALASKFEQSRLQLMQQMASYTQQRIQLDKAATETVVAQVSGRVSDVFVSQGKINKSKPLLTIVPSDFKFIAHLPVPTHAAGFIQQGQNLALRYDAYPHEKYGLQQGQVSSVSDSILLPDELVDSAIPVSQPVYMVRASVDDDVIYAHGINVPLKSGMTFSADVSLGERTVIEWLLAPLFSLKARL